MRRFTAQKSLITRYLSPGEDLFCPRFENCRSGEPAPACRCPLFSTNIESCRTCPACLACPPPGLTAREKTADGGQSAGVKCDQSRFSGWNNRLMESLAGKWLRKGGIKCPPVPVELVNLFDPSCEINVRFLPLKKCHGALWKTGGSWEIYINAGESAAEQRLTLFHEAFHILANLRTGPVYKKPGESQCLYNELLAESFASKILIPRKWLARDWAEVKDTTALSRKFQVTEKALSVRLEELHLTT